MLNSYNWNQKIRVTMKDKGHTLSETDIQRWIGIFVNELTAKDDIYKSLNDIKKHFINWLLIQLNKDPKQAKQTKPSFNL